MRHEQGIVVGDCVQAMMRMERASVDLAVCDPPFSIGHKYDVYDDDTTDQEYLDWCGVWLATLSPLLTPSGSFWLAIGDKMAADLDVFIRRKLGLVRRNWCLWHYSFGPNQTKKFTPSHAHLLHYVKDPDSFTFNADAVKVPSMRQLKYGDKRAKAGGRLPNDVWVLDSLAEARGGKHFSAEGSVWFESRVCGTHKERTAHPAQMPLPILERIVSVSSNPGDLVFDPMAGSGTTLVAAKKLGRRFLGVELSPAYADIIRLRLAEAA